MVAIVFIVCVSVCFCVAVLAYDRRERLEINRRWNAHERQQSFWEMQQTNKELAAMQRNGNKYVH